MGSELGWGPKIHPTAVLLPQSYMRSFVYLNPNWEYKDPTFSFDSACTLLKALNIASAKFSLLDADNPDLRPFEKHGGKIVMYHGWNDPDIAPTTMINYYERVVATVGGSYIATRRLPRRSEFAPPFMVLGAHGALWRRGRTELVQRIGRALRTGWSMLIPLELMVASRLNNGAAWPHASTMPVSKDSGL